jgi:hypothetical protein
VKNVEWDAVFWPLAVDAEWIVGTVPVQRDEMQHHHAHNDER